MNFSFYIAKRYLFSKSSNNAINIITIIAATGVLVGAAALFIVLSVFSGLKNFSLDFIRVADPDLKISSIKGKSFSFEQEMEKHLSDPSVIAYSKVLEEKAFFSYEGKPQIARIKGVDANYLTVNNIDTAIYVGEWLVSDIPNSAVIGNGISASLSLGTYDVMEPLKAYVPKPGKGYIRNPNTAFNQFNLQPIGIFRLTEELDKQYVFTNLALAQGLLDYRSDQISAIELRVDPNADRQELIDRLNERFGVDFKVQTREQLNAVFYRMINTENIVSYLVFTLILIIALFNVVGAIVMMILDKRKNLSTLFNLGATVQEIRKIFVLQGFLLSMVGLVLGLGIAIIFVLLQKYFGFIRITPSLAYPVEFRFFNVMVVVLTISALGFIAAKIASARISRKLIQ